MALCECFPAAFQRTCKPYFKTFSQKKSGVLRGGMAYVEIL